jgi:hypothetical protein
LLINEEDSCLAVADCTIMNGRIADLVILCPRIIPPLRLGIPSPADVGACDILQEIAEFFKTLITPLPSLSESTPAFDAVLLYLQEKSTTEKFRGVLLVYPLTDYFL